MSAGKRRNFPTTTKFNAKKNPFEEEEESRFVFPFHKLALYKNNKKWISIGDDSRRQTTKERRSFVGPPQRRERRTIPGSFSICDSLSLSLSFGFNFFLCLLGGIKWGLFFLSLIKHIKSECLSKKNKEGKKVYKKSRGSLERAPKKALLSCVCGLQREEDTTRRRVSRRR